MRKIVLMVFGLLALPALAHAVGDCPGCVLGLYDATNMLTNFGNITPFVQKPIYLGIKLAEGQTGLTGLEFSISGLENPDFIVQVASVTDPPVATLLGSAPAPLDTLTEEGGMNAAWASCVSGSQALLRIRVTWVGAEPVPANTILEVKHKYPPTNTEFGLSNPMLIGCDGPIFTGWRVTGGCYVLNYDAPSYGGDCQIITAIKPGTWTGVKTLYR